MLAISLLSEQHMTEAMVRLSLLQGLARARKLSHIVRKRGNCRSTSSTIEVICNIQLLTLVCLQFHTASVQKLSCHHFIVLKRIGFCGRE